MNLAYNLCAMNLRQRSELHIHPTYLLKMAAANDYLNYILKQLYEIVGYVSQKLFESHPVRKFMGDKKFSEKSDSKHFMMHTEKRQITIN